MFDRKSVKYPMDSEAFAWRPDLDELVDQLQHSSLESRCAVPSESFSWGLDLDELIDQLQHSPLHSRCIVATAQQLAACPDNANPSGRSVRSDTCTRESPHAPDAVQCPDGCGALIWVAGDERGRSIILDREPVPPLSRGGYVLEPLFVGPSADVVLVKDDTLSSSAKEFVELAAAWNWYATYESKAISSTSRFPLHVLTCARKTARQRARATNGQTYGGCCVPRSERKHAQALSAAERLSQNP